MDDTLDVRAISETADLIDHWWYGRSMLDRPRLYLGISIIGHRCDRYLWYSFRWAHYEVFSGRMERLFDRGREEEKRITDNLKHIGMKLDYILDNQAEFDFGCHIKGHPDGLILEGVPESQALHNLEMKTHNDRNFQELKKKGVKEAKPMHYAQMLCEMLGWKQVIGKKVDRSLYVAVNKNDDSLYTERIRQDENEARRYIERGQHIVVLDRPPIGISKDPSFFECKWCPYNGICHMKEKPEIHCRTCAHFTAAGDGKCYCSLYRSEIPDNFQWSGCRAHVIHPDLVPGWTLIPSMCTEQDFVYRIDEVMVVTNGPSGWDTRDLFKVVFDGYSIAELSADSDSVPF